MIVRQYIKEFEKLGLGMFVHFGLYSVEAKGEWAKHLRNIPDREYEALADSFCPAEDWAEGIARTAHENGCRYITLTTRHHDGFSLFDTKGLSDYDAMHAACHRDLVGEFVEACRRHGLVPFFYHTLIDWHEPTFSSDFKAYLAYLRESVRLLCRNYGKIGGFWFDGMWYDTSADWEEDALYGMIRQYQPDAMIINNTGINARGQLGHIELDSVTFERGKPVPINTEGAPKYIASEMCEVFNDHWGYAEDDINYKSPAQIITELADCRRYGSNFLMNVGPMPDGHLRPIDETMFGIIGRWMGYYGEAVYLPRPCGVGVINKKDDFILQKDNCYYLFCFDLGMAGDENVTARLYENHDYKDIFDLDKKVKSAIWLDTGEAVAFSQDGERVTVITEPFIYGRNTVVRVAKLISEV